MKKTTSSKISSVPEKIADKGGLQPNVSKEVSIETGVPEAEVYGVGSFFHLLSRSDAKIRVCQGLSCWMAGSSEVLSQSKNAGLPVEGCSCLAACDRPVAVLKDHFVLPDISANSIGSAGGNWRNLTSDTLDSDGQWLGHGDSYSENNDKLTINLNGDLDYKGEAFKRAMDMGSENIIEELNP